MYSHPTETQQVLLVIKKIIKWIKDPRIQAFFKDKQGVMSCSLAKVHCPVYFSAILFLRDYVVPRLGGIHSELIGVLCGSFCENQIWVERFSSNPQNYKQVEEIILSLFKELFQLPKLQHQDDNNTLIKYHLLQDFLKFLQQFLMNEQFQLSSSGLQFDNVLKEFRHLIPVFRDRPLQALQYSQVQCLWEQFEGLINEAGGFVYSFFFNPNLLDRKFCESLLISIELLKDDISEFLRTMPNLATSMVVYHDVDSFFIIHSLLNDLEDLISQHDGPIVEIKDLILRLHQGFKLSWSLLEERIEMKEFKEIATQVRDMAYGAEYMINCCLAGETHVWYVKLSLTSVIQQIELIGHQLLETKEGIGDCALRSVSDTFADEISMRDRMSGTELNEIIVGFEEEEQSIFEQLLGGTRNLQKVGIVGTPGLGKTTFARKLHNLPAVCDHFDKRSWCVFSQRYQWKDLLVDILKELGEEVELDMDEATLALQIYKTLKYRRYLITLDDIWNLDVWDGVRSCFPDDENGSRILFTSRNKDAAPPGEYLSSNVERDGKRSQQNAEDYPWL